MNFSAVILAGGKSSRMGRDKAWLETGGQTLLAHQIGLARETGAAEIFISGRPGADYSKFGCQVLQDKFPGAGPLAGIERALETAESPLLLVLAVDLPHMSREFLGQLSTHCRENAGAISRVGGGTEPLAAFYPKAAHALAATLLHENSNAVKNFAGCCVQGGLAVLVDFNEPHGALFNNCNPPAEFFVAGS